ncbi:MAG: leucine-rich repeat protein [Acholeplasmataceae bacterium]|nr:leucine-rich repeat protein [Acholeplasmataceae bacterium]
MKIYNGIKVFFLLVIMALVLIGCEEEMVEEPGITITFEANGGTVVAPQKVIEGARLSIPMTIREGYTLDGWYTSINGGVTFDEKWSFMSAAVGIELTLYAKWTPDQYQVSFDGQESDNDEGLSDIRVTYDDVYGSLPIPTKMGYTFIGWALDQERTSMIFEETVVKIATTHTLYAIWEINQYTINFDTNGGSVVESITEDYETVVTSPEDPIREGYTFMGWWDQAVPETMPSEDVFLTALWQINQYTIDFNSNGGSAIQPITQYYETTVMAPEDPIREGYTFMGWNQSVPEVMPAEDVELTALWQINQYTINFDTNGGSVVESITEDYETVVIAPEDPIREGYTFLGWWDQAVPETMPSEDVFLTALWQINQYTIDFNSNGGSAIQPITQDYETIVIAPEDPIREGYTFMGWYRDGLGAESYTFDLMPAENVNVQALWHNTITFESNGGSLVPSITLPAGTVISPPDHPIRNESIFMGWFIDEELLEEFVFLTMPESNMTLYAKWQVEQYSMIFYDADGTVLADDVYDYGTDQSQFTIPILVAEIGYSARWNEEIPETMPGEDLIFTAVYEFYLEYEEVDGQIMITGVNDRDLEVIHVPETINGLPVTIIEDYTFFNLTSLKEVTIPQSVIQIGMYAFDRTSKLTKITIPFVGHSRSATGAEAHFGYIFGTSSYTGSYNANGYYLPGSLKEVIITDVTTIKAEVFKGVSGVSTLVIPEGVTSIEANAFYGTDSLTALVIPDSVTSIASSAFRGASGLVSLTIPFVGRSRTAAGGNAHFGSVFGTSSYTGSYSANGYRLPTALKEVIVTDATIIGDHAFSGASSLTSLIIPDSVTSIGRYAFYFASSLESLVIPEGVTSIGSSAFRGTSGLTSLTVPFVGLSRTATGSDAYFGSVFGDISYTGSYYANGFYVPIALKEVIITDTTIIGDQAFRYVNRVSSIVIPDSVTSIGGYAFYGASSLESLVIPEGVTSIGDATFYGASSLESLVIPDGVTSIGASAFQGASSLISLIIPDSVASIGTSAFRGASSLEFLVIPEGVTTIGDSTFLGASSLVSLILPDSVTSIGASAFYGASSLASLVIPDSVTSMGFLSLQGTSSLTSLTIPFVGQSRTATGTDGFFGYVFGTNSYAESYNANGYYIPLALKEVVIRDATSIVASAFRDVVSISKIVIPESVSSIGLYAFSGADALTIYAESSLIPEGWHEKWNPDDRPVIWGFTEE